MRNAIKLGGGIFLLVTGLGLPFATVLAQTSYRSHPASSPLLSVRAEKYPRSLPKMDVPGQRSQTLAVSRELNNLEQRQVVSSRAVQSASRTDVSLRLRSFSRSAPPINFTYHPPSVSAPGKVQP